MANSAIVRHLYHVELTECSFSIRTTPDGVVIEIAIPASTDLTKPEEEGFASTFLSHALGEGFVMENGVRSVVRKYTGRSTPAVPLSEIVRQLLTQHN